MVTKNIIKYHNLKTWNINKGGVREGKERNP
uniref:Uncharacterized protein n=1 Tax=viral metagenome TaxID=1070528 RepID=A0A6C0L914_9ZZZZ